MNKQNKVGRPNKYQSEELRKEVRKQQNRINQQRRRRRIKLLQDMELFSSDNLSDGYRNTLANYINQYDFDYFFTGTVDPNKSQSQQLCLSKMSRNNTMYTYYSSQTLKRIISDV